jgi:peptide/nickel transport system permease protein
MLRLTVRRLMEMIPLLLAVIVVNFVVIQMAPGDPIQVLVGDFPAPPEYIEKLRHDLGLDKSVGHQLVDYLTHVIRGDLGFSFANRRPVTDLILERAFNTVLLTGTALTLASLLGVILGVSAARNRGSRIDNCLNIGSLFGFSIPVFWLAQVLIVIFSVKLAWLPSNGIVSARESYEGIDHLWDVAKHLILPVIALGLRYAVSTARLTRASVLEVLGAEYIVTAKAKGVSATRVLYKHALPNALLPVVTSIGHNFGYVLAGSALVETVFGWPGLGRLLYESMAARDTPVILGIFLASALVAVLANLVTDLLYGFLDPRIRRSKT